MIRKRALADFLARPRVDFRTYKALTPAVVEERVQKLNGGLPAHWNKLRKVQRICFLIGVETERFAMFLDTGVGKTFLAMALALHFNQPTLVLVPKRVNKWEWRRQIRKHAPEVSHLVLKGSSVKKWEELQSTKALVVIETYGGMARMLCDMVPLRRPKGHKKSKLRPNAQRTREFVAMFKHL